MYLNQFSLNAANNPVVQPPPIAALYSMSLHLIPYRWLQETLLYIEPENWILNELSDFINSFAKEGAAVFLKMFFILCVSGSSLFYDLM